MVDIASLIVKIKGVSLAEFRTNERCSRQKSNKLISVTLKDKTSRHVTDQDLNSTGHFQYQQSALRKNVQLNLIF